MHIRFQRDELLQSLNSVVGAVGRRPSLPILSYLLVRSQGEETTFIGTDLEVEVIARAKASVLEPGTMTLPARKLYDICRALPHDAEIDIRLQDSKALLKAGRSRFTLMTFPASDFPEIPATEWEFSLSLPQAILTDLFEQTYFCMAQQDIRFYLNGLLLELQDGRLRTVATDGHRMAISEAKLESTRGREKQVILPQKGVHELRRVLKSDGTIGLYIGPNHLRVQTDGIVLTTKLVDGRYPDYTKVIPAHLGDPVRIERQKFREALTRVAILSTETYRGVRLDLEGEILTITAYNPEHEEAQEEVPVKYQGAHKEVGFNVGYLIDAVNALKEDEVLLSLTDSNSSAVLRGAEGAYPKYIIMPMRL